MHAELGATYRAVGVFDEAVREYERALALCPTFADIRTELGKTRREMGPRRARWATRAGAGRAAALRAGGLHLGLSYQAAGRHEEAAAQWRAVLAAEPTNASARMYLAMLEGRCSHGHLFVRANRGRPSNALLATAMLTFTSTPDAFTVGEIPAYAGPGEGTHLFVSIEKRGLTTFDAIARLARLLDLGPRDLATPVSRIVTR